MKNLDESFDGEFARRLRNYLEEPRIELWKSIKTKADTNGQPSPLHKRTRTTWLLVLGLLTVGGLYYFARTGLTPTESPVLTTSTLPNDATGEGIVSESTSASENKKSSTIQQNEQFVQENNPVITKSINTNASAIVVEKTSTIRSEIVAIIRDEDITSDEDSSLSEQSSLSDESVTTVDDKPDTNKESSKSVMKTKTDDAIKKKNDDVMKKKNDENKKKDDEGKTVIKEKDKRQDKFSIYFTIMPTFGYQRINSNSQDDIIIESVHRISTFSTDRIGVRMELGAEDPLTEKIKIFGGLVYFQRKQTIDYTQKQVERTDVTQGPDGNIIVNPVYKYVEKSFEYELKNLGVQLGISYQLSRKKLLQTLGTGFEFHVALNKLEESYQAEFTNNPSAYVFYNLYYRLQYPAEGRLKAVFQPTLNYSFYINQDLHAPFYVKPYGLGLNLGFTYNF